MLIVMLVVYAALIRVAISRGGVPWVAAAVFVLAPVPLLFITATATGWGMAGPTAIAAFAAGLGACRLEGRWKLAPIPLVVGLIAVCALSSFGTGVLRPTTYSSRAEEAVRVGAQQVNSSSSVLVADDWTTQLLAEQEGLPTVDPAGFAQTAPASMPAHVILVFSDPGESAAVGWEDGVRERLKTLGFQPSANPIAVAPYDSFDLRDKLGLVAQPDQYMVEVWGR